MFRQVMISSLHGVKNNAEYNITWCKAAGNL